MRILHIITGLAAGGAEQQLRLLLRNMPDDHHCEVVTLENPGTVAEGIRQDGTPVTHLAMRGNRDIAALFKLAGFIRRGRFDIVHTHLYRSCVYGRLAARLAGVSTIVATEHSLLKNSIEGRSTTVGVRLLYTATERLGSCTVAVSSEVSECLSSWGIPAQRIRKIANGIDASAYTSTSVEHAKSRREVRTQLGIPLDSYVIGGVGRLVPGKQFDVLIDALASMPAALSDGRVPWLVLVGAGQQLDALTRQAREAQLADRTVFLGERDDVSRLLTALDVLAAPSIVETFGLSLLEALAAGLPVVYTSGPSLAELPRHYAGHAYYSPSDGRSYASRLSTVAAECVPPLTPPPVVGMYDISQVADELTCLYAELVARR
ncbi:glycosyltransferase involved in cell wall biosynthesis [Kitasatospora sp. MAP12-15]|uniref:glycosyltransferase n=1 Tax=unclassified Kitasatospora TaxID=2633591 RepID=UPI00247724B3|nr:glycosyltransferase [Kitasatospora sp. MAP12-44]MDH6115136.1 glycosyltransferase involved in cell wall biosynthesis [Kitasatospora sp. MAP12-44]